MRFREDAEGNLVIDGFDARQFSHFLGLPIVTSPRFLYKFGRVSSNLLSSLSEGYLWYSRPGDFNDPFDCKMVINWNTGSGWVLCSRGSASTTSQKETLLSQAPPSPGECFDRKRRH
jgi:hypothetical protein